MSIKTSQAILKCFIDLKSCVWFTLGSEDETVFCDTCNFFQLDCRSRFSKHQMAGSPIQSKRQTNFMPYIINETGLKENKYIIDIHCTFDILVARK